MTDVAKLEISIESSEAAIADKRLDQLEKQSGQTERATEKLTGATKRQTTATQAQSRASATLSATIKRAGASASGLNRTMGGLQLTMVKLVVISAALQAASFGLRSLSETEQGLVGVGKTANIAGIELQQLGLDIHSVGQDIPVLTGELQSIAQAAGQLGVTGSSNILKFTDTVGKLGTASDLSGEEAATSLARLLNVTRESVSTVGVLGSVIVRLGNEFAATESEITAVATRVAQATAVFDITAAETVALGAALRSVGVQAELAGSSIGKSFRAIDKAVRQGGEGLSSFAAIAGVSEREFADAFGSSSLKGFQLFIEGLGQIADQGGDVTAALEGVGLKGERLLQVLPTLATSSDILRSALLAMEDELVNVSALEEEAARGGDTLRGDWIRLRNAATQLSDSVGQRGLRGDLRGVINVAREMLLIMSGNEQALANASASALFFTSTIRAAGIALAALSLGKVATLFIALATKAAAAGGAMQLFNATIAASPVGAFVSIMSVAALVTADFAAGMAQVEARMVAADKEIRGFWTGSVAGLEQVTKARLELARAEQTGDALGQASAIRSQISTLEDEIIAIDARIKERLKTAPEDLVSAFKFSAADLRELLPEGSSAEKLLEEVGGRSLTASAQAQGEFFSKSVRAALEERVLELKAAIDELDVGDLQQAAADKADEAQKAIDAELVAALGDIDAFFAAFDTERQAIGKTDNQLRRMAAAAELASLSDKAQVGNKEELIKRLEEELDALEALEDADKQKTASDTARSAANSTLSGLQQQLFLQEKGADAAARYTAEIEFERLAILAWSDSMSTAEQQIDEFALLLDKVAESKALARTADDANRASKALAHMAFGLERSIVLAGQSFKQRRRTRVLLEGQSQAAIAFGGNTKAAEQAVNDLSAALDELERVEQIRQAAEGVGTAFGTAFRDAVFAAESLNQTINNLALSISESLFDAFVTAPLEENISNLANSFLGGAEAGGDTVAATAAATVTTSAAATAGLTATTAATTAAGIMTTGMTTAGAALISAATTAAGLLSASSGVGAVAGVGSAHGNLTGGGLAATLSRPGNKGFRHGVVIDKPTAFNLKGGGTGAVGEGGRKEGIFPLEVQPNGDLGIKGSTESQPVVTQQVTRTTNNFSMVVNAQDPNAFRLSGRQALADAGRKVGRR